MADSKPRIEIYQGGEWVVLDARIVAEDKNVRTVRFGDALDHAKDFDGVRIRIDGVEAISTVGESKAGGSVSIRVTLPVKRLGG